jgi:hypothetical protein
MIFRLKAVEDIVSARELRLIEASVCCVTGVCFSSAVIRLIGVSCEIDKCRDGKCQKLH